MKAEELFKNKAFDCLGEEQKRAFSRLYENIRGKTPQQALPVIMSFMQTMPKGRRLTEDEKNAIFAAVTADMTEQERRNAEALLKMII